MKKETDYPFVRLELLQREGVANRQNTIAELDLKLLWKQSPLTCTLVCRRIPFESLMVSRFFGKPAWKGYWFSGCHIAAWDRDPEMEFVTVDPEPGDLFYMPHPAGMSPSHHNPKQRQVHVSCCLLKKEIEQPMEIHGAPFASVLSQEDLKAFTGEATKTIHRNPLTDPPFLMRLTAEGIPQTKGIWKP